MDTYSCRNCNSEKTHRKDLTPTWSAVSLGIFDIVAIGPTDVVQCRSNDWPGMVEMETIRNFPAPPLCKKLIHRWRDRQRTPDVRIIEN